MKLFVRIGMFVFGLLALLSLSVSLTLVRRLSVSGIEAEEKEIPKYHFSLYLPSSRDSFFTQIIHGAERAAGEAGAVLSYHSIAPEKNELELASYTGVDGVIVCPYLDDRDARRQLEKLSAKKIPLVLINHSVASDHHWPYVGANNYDVGRRMGTIAEQAAAGPLRLAIVYSDKSPGVLADKELVEMGITSVLGKPLAAPIVGLRTGRNPFDAEELIYRLFRSSPEINMVIFTAADDTIAASQALIDMSLVGRVQLIGFGKDRPILEYIRKGILAGSVAVDPERIGYEAVKSLTELKTDGYTSSSVDTGVELVTGGSS